MLTITHEWKCDICGDIWKAESPEYDRYTQIAAPGYITQTHPMPPMGWWWLPTGDNWTGRTLVCPKHKIVVETERDS